MNSADLLVGNVFRVAARSVPNRVAAAIGERSITYGELNAEANRIARLLQSIGVGYRDRVVMWSDTSLDAVPLFAALAKIGAVFAPANALLGVEEAADMIELAEPSALVVDAGHATGGRELADRLNIPLLVLPIDAAAQSSDDVVCEELNEHDTHVIFFTSGSTGRSKGVMLSHRVNYLRTHPGSQIEPRGTTVCMYPLFHMGAWTIALQAFQTQTPIVFSGANPSAIVEAIEGWKATHFNAIPAVWRRILDFLDTDEGSGRDLSSLRIIDSGTSATPPALLNDLRRVAPQAVRRVFYGSTEAGAVTLLRDEDMARKPGSCGSPQHSVEISVAADTGELLVRGPLLFSGYYNDKAATDAAMAPGGWFRAGDLIDVDDEGFVSIVGRAKDIIRTGGETVAPSEVEEVLSDHPAFLDVAVVGIPDPQWGEVVCATVVLRSGVALPSVDDLAAHCRDRLAKFKRPRRIEVFDIIPRTPATNQVQRRLLIEQIAGR
jgi:acyl-CoA synthetase (AMP-forming)/AMP-acid ligase II